MLMTLKNRLATAPIEKRRWNTRRRGQALLEFALIAPIFLVLVLGVVQFGLLTQATEIVTNLTREGARFASLGPDRKDVDIKSYIIRQTSETPLRRGSDPTVNDDLSIAIMPAEAARTKGAQVTVSVTYNLRSRIFLPITGTLLTSFPKNANGDPLYISTSIMRIVN